MMASCCPVVLASLKPPATVLDPSKIAFRRWRSAKSLRFSSFNLTGFRIWAIPLCFLLLVSQFGRQGFADENLIIDDGSTIEVVEEEASVHQIRIDSSERRLRIAGLIGAGVLGILSVVFGCLRIDLATRGFYSRRLQTISALLLAAIILVIYIVLHRLI